MGRQVTEERWLPVVGYEGLYEVSDQGRVRSLDRWVPYRNSRRFCKGVMLKPSVGEPPMCYLYVRLSKRKRYQMKRIHVLVLETFVGPRPPGMVACHNNSQPHDLRLENLRWDTHAANTRDIMDLDRHHNAKKTECKRGHRFTPENTYITTNGGRCCRQCVRDKRGVIEPRPERYRRAS